MDARIRFQDGRVIVDSSNLTTPRVFATEENLSKALEKLKLLNGLKFKGGTPLYRSHLYQGKYSIWSFFQEVTFWQELRYFVKYEEVFKFFFSQTGKQKIAVDDSQLAGLLSRLPNVEIVGSKNKKFQKTIAGFFLKMVGTLLTYLGILKLVFLRVPTIVYTPDKASGENRCDFRMNAIYEYLRKNKIPYVEFFHTNLTVEFLKNFFRRKRLAIYLECLVSKKHASQLDVSVVQWPALEPYELFFLKSLIGQIDAYCLRSRKLIGRLFSILKLSGVKRLISLDDMRYANELLVVCKEKDIRTVAFEHGQFSKYHVGWMNYGIPRELSITFDTLFVWNRYWQEILLEYSNKFTLANTEIGGQPTLTSRVVPVKKKQNETPIVLVPFEVSVAGYEVKPYVDKLIECGFKVYFCVRSDIAHAQQLALYGLENNRQITVIRKLDEKIISEIDAVVGVHSTLLSEMMYYHKPIFQIIGNFDLGHRLRDKGLSIPLKMDFDRAYIVNHIANHKTKKDIVWPSAPTTKEVCERIFNTSV